MIMTKMQKSRSIMLLKQPFFASLLMSTPMHEVDEDWFLSRGIATATAATDMENFYYYAPFIDSLSPEVVLFVLAHEVMHVALAHGIRRGNRNPQLWNIACDYAINMMLKDTGFTLWDKCLYDEKYRGMSADQIYDQLVKAMDKDKAKGGKGDPSEMFGDGGGMVGDVQAPEHGGDPAAQARTKRSIQQRVAQAASVARMQGKFGGALEQMVSELLDPKVPWQHVLRDFMCRVAEDDEDWNQRDRRFQHVFLPHLFSEKMGPVIAIGDASGSCYDDMPRYFAEFRSIAEDMKPEYIKVVWADTRITAVQTFEEGDDIVLGPKGFGGTDMCVPLKEVEDMEPEVVILFTDGYTPWPDVEPPYPLIVCCTTNAKCPIGVVIRI